MDQVKETMKQLPPLATVSDVDALREDVGVMWGLFLTLMGGLYLFTRSLREEMRAEAKTLADAALDEASDVERRTSDDITASERRLMDALSASERRMLEAVRVSEEKTTISIVNYATIMANAITEFKFAKDELWAKADELTNARIDDARKLATRDDLEVCRQDDRKDRRDMEDRVMNGISELRGTVIELLRRS